MLSEVVFSILFFPVIVYAGYCSLLHISLMQETAASSVPTVKYISTRQEHDHWDTRTHTTEMAVHNFLFAPWSAHAYTHRQ